MNRSKKKRPSVAKRATPRTLEMALQYHQQGQLAEAEIIYREILAANPKQPDALHLLGLIAYAKGQYAEALDLIERAIAIDPLKASYHSNRGNALQVLKRLDEALAGFNEAIRLKPDYAEAFNNRGSVLGRLKRFDEALVSYDTAVRLKTDYADAFSNRGSMLGHLKRFDEAVASFDQAIQIKPDHAQAFCNRGIALQELKQLDEALASYDQAIRYKPNHTFAAGMFTHVSHLLCKWNDLSNRSSAITAGILSGNVTRPFPLLSLIDDPPLHRKAAETWAKNEVSTSGLLNSIPQKSRRDKIHIAYLSADFHQHATSYLMAQLFELHDRQRFELTAISFGPDNNDNMRQRVAAAFDHFVDVRNKSDLDVAKLCRELGVDIAIDLKGFTRDSRPGILAERCAPIQINWLGYPGTMAAPFIDYIIADHTLITPADLEHYSEKVIWLPHSYQVNDSKRPIAERQFTRADCGLPESGFVYCCFNNNYKILPATFDVWMRILQRVPNSVLWLFADNPQAPDNLRREAAARSVNSERLIFAQRLPLAEHLARHRVADLFIDTWPCNAHTTASDALWAGLPLLTLRGQSFAARVAASLLTAIGLPELITHSVAQYEELAVAFAQQPERLAQLKATLQANRLTAPLFNCALFTRHLETAYCQIMERYWSEQLLDHLVISDTAAAITPVNSLPIIPLHTAVQCAPNTIESVLALTRRIEVLDVGAACIAEEPVYQRLLNRHIAHLHAFEGDERHIAKMKSTFGDAVTIYPAFLFDGTPQTVHLASSESGMTSLLQPRAAALHFFNGFDKFGVIHKTVPVTTRRLDDIADLPAIDFLKMDIQGAELTVLQHGQHVLRHCVAMQLEVSFITLYDNQPAFGDVDVWLRSQGFVPHCFLQVKRWSIAPTIRNNNFRTPFNQLLEADIVYIRDPLTVSTWETEQIKKLAVIAHDCFGSIDLAMYLLLELIRRDPAAEQIKQQYLALANTPQPSTK